MSSPVPGRFPALIPVEGRARLVEQSCASIRGFVPAEWIEPLRSVLESAPILVKVVRARRTKHGDHRLDGFSRISVNASGNCWQFIITLLHEVAHAQVTHSGIRRAAPHGSEWKKAFRDLLLGHLALFPPELAPAVAAYARNPLFSSGCHTGLAAALRRYDTMDLRKTVQELSPGQRFSLDGRRVFRKGPRLRTRYKCEASDGRVYLVAAAARVETVYGMDHPG